MVTRRRVVLALGAGALVPFASFGQQTTKVPRIGFLSLSTPWEAQDAFRERLRELGYIDGQNLIVHYRFANGSRERLLQDARELAKTRVDIILAVANAGALAAHQATDTLPVVFVFAIQRDPAIKDRGTFVRFGFQCLVAVLKQLIPFGFLNPFARWNDERLYRDLFFARRLGPAVTGTHQDRNRCGPQD